MRHHERGALKACKRCMEEKPLQEFHRNKRMKDGYHYYCKVCNKDNALKGYYKNHAKSLETRTAYRDANRHTPEYKEAHRLSTQSWRNANRERYRALQRQRKVATPKWSETEAIKAMYMEAKRLTALTGIQHDVDHIIPLFGGIVSGLHVLSNLQILTRRENQEKGQSLAMI